ncbi:MAG: DUF1624 domain-containing protein [Deltaproteobacteria bacterium]|nr:DUF1624 domain-containing protein [Deltaproteobacteria bacterium]
MPKKKRRERYPVIDCVRGVAVLLMIVFHCAYDLNGFGLVRIDFSGNVFWFVLPRFIVTLFMLCVGTCLFIVHRGEIKWSSMRSRLLRIGGWALGITLITYLLFPKNFVFFGILHCIAVSSLLALPFVNRSIAALVLGLALVIPGMFFPWSLTPVSDWLDINPMDYVPLYPWFGVVLLGIYLGSRNIYRMELGDGPLKRFLGFLGRHSLQIYLIHRPVVFSAVFALYRWKTSG